MDDVDLIKQKVDVGDLIGSYISLKRAGRNLKAVCPFHNEKSPSFVVSPERQIWHCFGCGKGGDIFTFVEEYERVDFSEALNLLAEKAGIKLRKTAFHSEKEEIKNRIYEINHLSSLFYHYLLTKHPSGKSALYYVTKERELTPALIKTYAIGYAPGQPDALVSYLLKKKHYTREELIEAGVATLRNGRLFDFFQNRLVFPLTDSRGNILAFSGRALTDNQQPKYINTKETPVYIKGDTLFGLDIAKEAIKKEGKALLMEGEFDVITSFKEGIANAVAVKGTALTENQIRLLKRFAQKIVFCFDTDPAGTEAQRRSISLITKEGMNASVVIPPHGKDPDELLRENPLLFKKAVKNEVNIYDYIIDTASGGEDITKVEGKKKMLSRTLPYLNDIENEIVKEHYLKKIAELLDTSYESVIKEAEKEKKPAPKVEDTKEKLPSKSREKMLEEHLLTLVLQSQNPKESLIVASSVLETVEPATKSAKGIYAFLKKHFLANDTLPVAEANTLLPKEFVPSFDMYLLNPIPVFTSIELYHHEIEKVARLVKQTAIRLLLQNISQKMKEEEKKGDEEMLQKLRVEFNTIASHYK